jgi:hypothetical protein
VKAVVISTEGTTGTVAGDRWLHQVQVDDLVVEVVARRSGLGWAMEVTTADYHVASAAMGAVAAAPMGVAA